MKEIGYKGHKGRRSPQEQPGGKLAPPLQAKRTRDVAVQANVEFTKVRFNARLTPQSFQLRSPHKP